MLYGVYAHLDGGMYWKTAVIDNEIDRETAERLAKKVREDLKTDNKRTKDIENLFNNRFVIDIIVAESDVVERRKVKQYIEPYNSKIINILTK